SSGYTECTPIELDGNGLRRATATWHTRGHGINFQPVSAYPEPGLMTWDDGGTVMREEAPSGAYVEEWRLVPGSRDPLFARSGTPYRAGDVAVLVRDRPIAARRAARLPELVDEFADDRATLEGLLDCEFSIAERRDGEWTISASTLPWREGAHVDVR